MFPDIRFKNNGLDSIEVQDNGPGISYDDYNTIGEHVLSYTERNALIAP